MKTLVYMKLSKFKNLEVIKTSYKYLTPKKDIYS